MKKLFLFVILFTALFTYEAASQVLLDENFNYTTGDSLGAHSWVSFSGGATNLLIVATNSLTFPGYINSGIGGQVRVHNNGQDAYTSFTPVTAGSFYTSFLVMVDSSQALGGDYFVGLLPSTSTTNYTARFYAKDTTAGMVFGITKGAFATNPVVYSTATYLHNSVYLVVIKYTFLTGSTTDDEMRVYIFNTSVPGTEPSTPTIGPVTGVATDALDLGRFAIRQGSAAVAPSLWIDGIRVCSSWSNIPTGVMPVGTITPNHFSLNQNYPNPFNPSTNIEFSVPKSSFVTLRVYDALGREVSSLVNENLISGTYRSVFNANNFASGVYYYKLVAIENISKETFIDTKPMVLVK